MRPLILSIMLAFFLIQSSFADTLYLDDQSEIKGKITKISPAEFEIQTEYGNLTIPKNRVQNYTQEPEIVAFKQEAEDSNLKNSNNSYSQSGLTRPDSYYFIVNFGLGMQRPGGALKTKLDGYDDKLNHYTDSQDRMDFFLGGGFLFPIKTKILVGPSFYWNYIFPYSKTKGETFSVNLNAYMFHLDFRLFFREIGKGGYIYAAPALGFISYQETVRDYNDSAAEPRERYFFRTRLATGFKAGIGWAYSKVRYERAVLVGLEGFYYTGKHSEEGVDKTYSIQGVNLSVGFLW